MSDESAEQRAARINAKVCSRAEDFNKALDEYCVECVPLFFKVVQDKLCLQALAGVVKKTPVDTGRARGNWQIAMAEPPEGESWVTDPIGIGMSKLRSFLPYSLVWIANNVPYIIWLEDGHSKQTPAGMVSVTMEELKTVFEGNIE